MDYNKLTDLQKSILNDRRTIETMIVSHNQIIYQLQEKLKELRTNICKHDGDRKDHVGAISEDNWTECLICGSEIKESINTTNSTTA